MNGQAGLYALWAWLFVTLGLSLAVLGPALPALRAHFGVSLAQSGLLFAVHAAGYLTGVLIAGPMADARGRRFVAGAGAALLAAGMTLAAAAPSWLIVLATMALAGLGFAFVDVGLNAAIGDTAAGQAQRAAAMNLFHATFPLGTLAAPALLALAWLWELDWRAVFLFTGLAAGTSLVGVAVPRLAWPTGPPAATATLAVPAPVALKPAIQVPLLPVRRVPARRARVPGLLREPYLRTTAALQALYVAAELGISGWLATYLIVGFGAAESSGALATSGFWAGFLAGRPIIAYATHRLGPHRVLCGLLLAGIATAAAGVLAPAAGAATVMWMVTGLAISGVFPLVMALALEGRRGDAGSVVALITGAAAVGGLVWPWLVGAIAEAAGLRVAMAAAAAPLLPMLALALSMPPSPSVAAPAK